MMIRSLKHIAPSLAFVFILAVACTAATQQSPAPSGGEFDGLISSNVNAMIEEGRQTFRYDTFGDEGFWSDGLKLHQAIAGAAQQGVGPGVSPKTALSVGLKVDAAALPKELVAQLKAGKVNLDDPATTLVLLKFDAVVGIKGTSNKDGSLKAIGITCALCHSTVDNSFSPGIGRRLDGWPNRDLNVGAIISLAPDLSPVMGLLGVDEKTLKQVLVGWGAGKFDAVVFMNGKATRPDGGSGATLIPPAFGLAGVNLHTFTGWGSVTYWNTFVANLEMHGKGTFYDPRLKNAAQYPVAAKAGFGEVRSSEDLITSKLAALHFYQLAIPAPVPPQGKFPRRCGDARPARIQWSWEVRVMSCPPAVHGAWLEYAHAWRDWNRRLSSESFARQALPDNAAQRALRTSERWLLP